ncbi:MAG: NADP-dependent oxidoreductase [Rudaea sp.]
MPAAHVNRRIVLASRPAAAVTEDNFRLEEAPLGAPAEGEVLVRNEWLSLDPYMRGRMSDAKSYATPAAIGEVMVGQTIGEVLASRDPRLVPGDKVLTNLGWQAFGVCKAADVEKIDARDVPASYYLGILGMPGITAFIGLTEIGRPKPGDTLVVSAASGAVGSVVGQLARMAGCRVVGVAGGAQKCDYVVDDLGFDACVDHRAQDFETRLRAACPHGVDVDFENVGGKVLDAVLGLVNRHARIVLCGVVAEYGGAYAHARIRSILVNRVRMEGMIVFDWKDRYAEATARLREFVVDGRLKYRESIVEGLENAPKGLIGLLRGGNFGKQLVRIA